jgi:predicted nucleic-acid-binding protein
VTRTDGGVIALDTNVLVRLIVHDDAKQAARARALLEECAERDEPCFVATPVLCELAWVLRRVYKAAPADIADALRLLLDTALLEFEDTDLLRTALRAYIDGKADFADYVIGALGRRHGARTTCTFDRALRREPDFTLL